MRRSNETYALWTVQKIMKSARIGKQERTCYRHNAAGKWPSFLRRLVKCKKRQSHYVKKWLKINVKVPSSWILKNIIFLNRNFNLEKKIVTYMCPFYSLNFENLKLSRALIRGGVSINRLHIFLSVLFSEPQNSNKGLCFPIERD